MKDSKDKKRGIANLSRRKIVAYGRQGGHARAAKLTEAQLSAIGEMGGRPPTTLARAKALGVKIPRGASRQWAWKLLKRAEVEKARGRKNDAANKDRQQKSRRKGKTPQTRSKRSRL